MNNIYHISEIEEKLCEYLKENTDPTDPEFWLEFRKHNIDIHVFEGEVECEGQIRYVAYALCKDPKTNEYRTDLDTVLFDGELRC